VRLLLTPLMLAISAASFGKQEATQLSTLLGVPEARIVIEAMDGPQNGPLSRYRYSVKGSSRRGAIYFDATTGAWTSWTQLDVVATAMKSRASSPGHQQNALRAAREVSRKYCSASLGRLSPPEVQWLPRGSWHFVWREQLSPRVYTGGYMVADLTGTPHQLISLSIYVPKRISGKDDVELNEAAAREKAKQALPVEQRSVRLDGLLILSHRRAQYGPVWLFTGIYRKERVLVWVDGMTGAVL